MNIDKEVMLTQQVLLFASRENKIGNEDQESHQVQFKMHIW